MRRVGPGVLAALCPVAAAAIDVEYAAEAEAALSAPDRVRIEAVAQATEAEVRGLLPGLPETLVLEVRAEALPYSPQGLSGQAVRPDRVVAIVDPGRGEGVGEIADASLRGFLFHELHHLVRACTDESGAYASFFDAAICEGMATAFARDHGGAEQSWAEYPPEIAEWYAEVRNLPPAAATGEYMFFHSDGRAWVGYKVGTWLVDRAMAASGLTAAELTDATTAEILELAAPE